MPPAPPAVPRVLLVCSGLDHAHRGFESFARECFEALRTGPELEITLIKGSGQVAPGERSIPTVTRDAPIAKLAARAWRREPFRVEQVAFGASLLPLVARQRPDVVYFSEWHTGLVLGAYRRISPHRPSLVLCNGTMAAQGFGHLDRVQELTPAALQAALAHGDTPSRHVLLPLGFAFNDAPMPSAGERAALRDRLGLPRNRQLILSVAALNRHHKRLDYLIEEVARLGEPRPFLLLAGDEEAETPELRELAARLLGPAGHSIRTVPAEEVGDLYRASDVFVLASLGEAFGRVLVEAMAHGLPCVAHDYEVTRYVLGNHGILGDLSKPGELARLLQSVVGGDASGEDDGRAAERRRFVYEKFSWERLRPTYVDFLKAAALSSRAHSGRPANNTVSSSSGEHVWTK